MVAHLPQQYRLHSCDFLVCEFFRIYSTWGWPEPIFLYDVEEKNGAFPVWDWKRDFEHSDHKMPIINLAYPCNNVTSRVTPNTFRFLCKKLRQGHDIYQDFGVKNANWEDLFNPMSTLG